MASRSGITRAEKATASHEHRSLLGKSELASELGWTRPRLDRYLAAHADFPVAAPGARGPLYDVGQVRSFIARASKLPAAGGGRSPAVQTPPVYDRIVGKKELAAELGWNRPYLDRYIDRTGSIFPVRKRGERSGGWEFSVADVRAFLAGQPIPSRDDGTAIERPPKMELFERADFESSVDALRARCLPIAAHEPCRSHGLNETQLQVLASCFEFLPQEEVAGGFENAVAAAVEAARLSAQRICDVFESGVSPLPDPIPAEDLRGLYRTKFRMLGAMLDLFEHSLLTFPGVPVEQRNYVRTMFDTKRSWIVEDYRQQLV
jgi:hypothetical protein